MIYVLRNDGAADRYATGAKWHIDEDELLHILDGSKVGLGSYARGQWASVHTTKDDSWGSYSSPSDLS